MVVFVVMVAALLPALRTPDLPAESFAPEGATRDRRPGGDPSSSGTWDDPIGAVGVARLPPIEVPTDTLVPIGTVRIPKVGLDTPFFSGVHEEILKRGAGHWPGTARVGEAGNAVLSGHRTTHTAPFGDLDLLAPGDEVHVDIGSEARFTYEVVGTQVVPQEQYVDVVLAEPEAPGEHLLTMFACHPKGSAAERIIVQARLQEMPSPIRAVGH